jgi:hypothetical protein
MIAIEACTDYPVQASPGAASLVKMELFRFWRVTLPHAV